MQSAATLLIANAPPPVCFAAPGAPWVGEDPRGHARGSGAPRRRSGACEAPLGRALTHAETLARRLTSLGEGRSPLGAPPRHFSPGPLYRQRHEAFVRGAPVRPRRWSRTTAAGSRSLLRLQDRLRKTPLDEPGCAVTSIL